MPYKNKEDQAKYAKQWYLNNKDKQRKASKEYKQRTLVWYKDYKKTLKCQNCPENHPYCLEFHHNNDDKDLSVSQLIANGYGKPTILKEINKCIVLCANCHRKLHYPL